MLRVILEPTALRFGAFETVGVLPVSTSIGGGLDFCAIRKAPQRPRLENLSARRVAAIRRSKAPKSIDGLARASSQLDRSREASVRPMDSIEPNRLPLHGGGS